MQLAELQTPALVLDRTVLARNCAAMAKRGAAHGLRLRPHLKTAKSAEVAALATAGQFGGITVSTLAEARYFPRAASATSPMPSASCRASWARSRRCSATAPGSR